jgi:hypothetical protein
MHRSCSLSYHLKGLAFYVLHRVPEVVTEEEIGAVTAIEDQFRYQHLALGCKNKLKRWTQNDNPMQEVVTAIEQLIHHAFPALHKDRICRGPGKAFRNGIGRQGIK